MPDLPTGRVTLLFTDIECSTRPWVQHRETVRFAFELAEMVFGFEGITICYLSKLPNKLGRDWK